MATNSGLSGSTMDLEAKRQSLFASLLKYSPEAGSLRSRALERLVLVGLLGSTPREPFGLESVRRNLRFGPNCPLIRSTYLQQTLNDLVAGGQVQCASRGRTGVYWLASATEQQLAREVEASTRLFSEVLQRLLRDTNHLISFEAASTICRTFICECFSRFGLQLAKTVIGEANVDDLIRPEELRAAFSTALRGQQLPGETVSSLQSRCFAFMHSSDPDDERLKFYLTQAFFFSQLLGMETSRFNPLAEGAFSGATFYLDSNVLIPRLLASDEEATLFDEMIKLTSRAGIELRVTRAAINEIRRVAVSREAAIQTIVSALPDQLATRTNDRFLETYLKRRESNPSLTAAAFIEPFMGVERILRDELAVTVDERDEDGIPSSIHAERTAKAIQEEALAVRGWEKSEPVLRHDVFHHLLVIEERKKQQKTWFLTRDRTMIQAATKLDAGQPPVSFSFVGLLQSISPFVINGGSEHALVDMFSALLTEQVMPADLVFDIQELKLIAEMHQDILATPPDQLVRAFDYVKSAVLHGRAYRPDDHTTVSLGLRKYLSSSADDRRRQLEAESERWRMETQRESEERVAERIRREAAEERVAELSDEVRELRLERERERQQAADALEKDRRAGRRRALWMMIAGFGVGVVLWSTSDVVARQVAAAWPALGATDTALRAILGVLGILAFTLPSVSYTRRAGWRTEGQVLLLTGVLATAFAGSRLLAADAWSEWSAYFQIAAFLAPVIIAVMHHVTYKKSETR